MFSEEYDIFKFKVIIGYLFFSMRLIDYAIKKSKSALFTNKISYIYKINHIYT